LLEAAHQAELPLEMPVIPLRSVVQILGRVVLGLEQRPQHGRVAGGLVGDHTLRGDAGLGDGPLKDGAGGRRILAELRGQPEPFGPEEGLTARAVR
jgi:hypothetical protein